jgi:hypothetical protein
MPRAQRALPAAKWLASRRSAVLLPFASDSRLLGRNEQEEGDCPRSLPLTSPKAKGLATVSRKFTQ